jgi:hypothetical protein
MLRAYLSIKHGSKETGKYFDLGIEVTRRTNLRIVIRRIKRISEKPILENFRKSMLIDTANTSRINNCDMATERPPSGTARDGRCCGTVVGC